MRILYGITGEGLGHALRARVVVPHLERQGHRVLVAASGRAFEMFQGHDAIEIEGLHMRYRDGAVQRIETLVANAMRARRVVDKNFGSALHAAIEFDPDVVISDFDSFGYGVGRALDRPVISFDHQHVLGRFRHPPEVLARVSYDYPVARSLVRRKMPACASYLVTSFYFPEAVNDTELLGPVLRPEIEHASAREGEHVLVYQTAAGDPQLLRALEAVPDALFRIYGLGARPARRHLSFMPFDEARFVDDLASARAVITNGGFMTLSEAVVLGKPILSRPIHHQGEQELNAAWLAHLGLGIARRRVQPEDVRALLRFTPRGRVQPGTQAALGSIDRAIARAS